VIATSIVSRSGTVGIRLDEFEDRKHIFDRDALGLAFRVQLSPGARSSRVVVFLDPLIEHNQQAWGFKTLAHLSEEDAVIQIGIAVIAAHLDGMSPDAVQAIQSVECWSECLERLATRTRATDEEMLQYLRAKLYWAWKYDLEGVGLAPFDGLLLGVDPLVLDRVSRIAEGDGLRRTAHPSGGVYYEPLPRLLREFPLQLSPAGSATSGDVLLQLAPARYAGPRHHLAKAIDLLAIEPPDHANAAKEAISAVEGMARIVASDPSATLGELITRLKSQGRLNPALAKSLEGAWGFTNTSPGVRHGSIVPPTITPAEAEFVLGAAKVGITLLLDLDTP
jgi:hypothetical protein